MSGCSHEKCLRDKCKTCCYCGTTLVRARQENPRTWFIEHRPDDYPEHAFSLAHPDGSRFDYRDRASAYVPLDDYLKLQAQCDALAEALEFYAPANSYDYDKVQGINYIWNDQGKKARQALQEYNKFKEEA